MKGSVGFLELLFLRFLLSSFDVSGRLDNRLFRGLANPQVLLPLKLDILCSCQTYTVLLLRTFHIASLSVVSENSLKIVSVKGEF